MGHLDRAEVLLAEPVLSNRPLELAVRRELDTGDVVPGCARLFGRKERGSTGGAGQLDADIAVEVHRSHAVLSDREPDVDHLTRSR